MSFGWPDKHSESIPGCGTGCLIIVEYSLYRTPRNAAATRDLSYAYGTEGRQQESSPLAFGSTIFRHDLFDILNETSLNVFEPVRLLPDMGNRSDHDPAAA